MSLALVFWLSFELEVKEVGAEYSRKELLNETLVKLSKFLTYPLRQHLLNHKQNKEMISTTDLTSNFF